MLKEFLNKYKGALITIVIIVIALLIASWYVDFSEIGKVLITAVTTNVHLLILAVLLECGSLSLKTLRLQTIVSELRPISFVELFKIQAAGIAISNLTPARIGEASKAIYLEQNGIKKRLGLLAILWEHLFDFIAIIAFSMLIASQYGAVAILFLAVVAIVIFLTYHIDKFIKYIAHIKQLAFLGDLTLHKFKKMTLAKALFVTFLAWTCDFLAVATAFHAVGVTLPYTVIMGAFAISIIIGLISTIPGGFGSLEASLYVLLNSGFSNATLGAAFVAARVVTVGTLFVVGGLSAISLHSKKASDKPT
ncbi:MAG: lysylphosphatidylglycerol synthase transmembrane domain-containing protein [Candidatus Micrarchaeota archaeon]